MIEIPIIPLTVKFDFKEFKDVPYPAFLDHNDAARQYVGIWQIIANYVEKMNAKKVLEFGTREGYSTQLFSNLLKGTDGFLWSVDLDDPKIPDEIKSKLVNVSFIKSDILKLDWKDQVDILYIDDWHNPYHLFGELDRFANFAKVILIHDTSQNWQTNEWLLPAVFSWCQKEFTAFTVYPLNGCGLTAIHRKEFEDFYENK